MSDTERQIPHNTSKILLVEGPDDKEFFIQLMKHLKIPDMHIWVTIFDKDQIAPYLKLLRNDPNFLNVTSLGIVRDADFTGGAFDSVVKGIERANEGNSQRSPYGVPQQPLSFTDELIKVGILILPSVEGEGMLENLIISVLRNQDSDIMTCVDKYFECLKKTGITLKEQPLPKATMRVYMAAHYQAQVRSFIEAKNVDEQAKRKDRKRSYLTDIYRMSWWSWDDPILEDAKTFLRTLAEG